MSDLVERLLSLKPFLEAHHCSIEAIDEAASEIQSLSERIAVLEGAIDKIANGRINTDFIMSEPPDWHKAFGEMQAIAKAASLIRKGENATE